MMFVWVHDDLSSMPHMDIGLLASPSTCISEPEPALMCKCSTEYTCLRYMCAYRGCYVTGTQTRQPNIQRVKPERYQEAAEGS